ncbi:MAG TPA: S8 family serine peptidase [Planctomicrobium sp.]|nr:S8 family serine peptidase [Planctomicrobium sp.]
MALLSAISVVNYGAVAVYIKIGSGLMANSDVVLLLRLPKSANAALSGTTQGRLKKAGGLTLEPLFETASPMSVGLGLSGRGQSREWYAAHCAGTAGKNPWDVAHELVGRINRTGLAANETPDVIEPDLLQQWEWDEASPNRSSGLAADSACVFMDQNRKNPHITGEFAWHLGDSFSQLETARDIAASTHDGETIRIAHLDTGYDQEHRALAAIRFAKSLQRNFIDSNRTNDARDLGVDGMLKNPGHGTGTLGILAGGLFSYGGNGYDFHGVLGGAPSAEIVPIRVGNSVVQLTTSAVVKGIDYAVDLCQKEKTRIHVISMSMGGVASAAWADAVNKAYEAGITFVAAAGNNYSTGKFGVPTRHIVYPARFRRVLAACGVMADRTPYFGLAAGTMQGNWGPDGAMATALSAFTPNTPWAQWGCSEIVRMDGAGTSSATPQIAAAAALYLQRYANELFDKHKYPELWMRVEAIRYALFSSAEMPADSGNRQRLGNGILRAKDALEIKPLAASRLKKTAPDSAGFPFLNVLSRSALAPSELDVMLQLEATQLVQKWHSRKEPNPLEQAVTDPDRPHDDIPPRQINDFLEQVADHPHASQQLKERARQVLGTSGRGRATKAQRKTESVEKSIAATSIFDEQQEKVVSVIPPEPDFRKLRGYSVDPSLCSRLDTVGISQITLKVPWEDLSPGPSGEYLEVIDVDPASQKFYPPVNLNLPVLLAQDGLAPSEGNPQFHQQMVYAVASLTIHHFEQALGRKALWRPGVPPEGKNKKDDSHFVQCLRIYPHALREANAYYSPNKVALLFGYFDAVNTDDVKQLPGGRVFTCLSHDIIAHETTHALLDGMHRQMLLPSNPDVLAFHEGFADCVAMLQHFTFPELVADQIRETRGEIWGKDNILTKLAVQFGFATGRDGALRDATGQISNGMWLKNAPDPTAYKTVFQPHERGKILVSAVFDAFLSIYQRRTKDLVRLATGGTGILLQGSIHPDLVQRLADEASKTAQQVLRMCIRALDYCPPTDITFGEYLRAIITADCDVIADDKLGYRVSFIEAFQRRGIFPPKVRTLSVESLRWRTVEEEESSPSDWLLGHMKTLRAIAGRIMFAKTRKDIFDQERKLRARIHNALKEHFQKSGLDGENDAKFLGIVRNKSFEVHTARVAFRPRPDGRMTPQLLIGLLQSTKRPVDESNPQGLSMGFEAGCAIVIDLYQKKIRYCIRKNPLGGARLALQQEYANRELSSPRSTYFGRQLLDPRSWENDEPFALVHRSY